MNIVFMGTPDFSTPCLYALVNAGHNVSAVFTQPDKPKGRKMVLTPPPVKELAQKLNIDVYQPKTLRDGTAFEILKKYNPDVIVVVAYGKFLPKEILDLPKYGCVNVHASLLPRHRGASPIQWCIVCGDKQTGVCTMLMDEDMDTGDILEVAKTDIGENENAEELFEKLSSMGANLIVSTIQKLEQGSIIPQKQPATGVTYAPIIKKEMGELDFNKPAAELHNAVRGFYPWPATYFTFQNKRYKVLKAKVYGKVNCPAATVAESDNKLVIGCGDGMGLEILSIQPEGSRAMSIEDYLKGHTLDKGTVIE